MPTIGVPTRGGDVRRPGIARHHQRRAARQRDEIGDGRLRREHRGAVGAATTSARERLLARSPQHDRHQPVPLAQRRRDAAEPRRRPALVRPRRAGIQQRVAAAGLLARSRRAAAESTASIGNSGAGAVMPERAQQAEVDVDDVPRLARIVQAAAAGIVARRCRTAAPAARARSATRSR